MKEPYIVLDIETTGLSKHQNRITEIAAIKIENKKLVQDFKTLVNPEVKIPSFITSLTGITNAMVKDSPVIEEVIPNFIKFLGNIPLVGHCVSFDYGFLNYNSQKHLDLELINKKICTRKLARRLVTNLPSYKLSSLCSHFNINNQLAHRAMADVEVTHKIFKELSSLMEKQGIEKIEQVLDFQDSKIYKNKNR